MADGTKPSIFRFGDSVLDLERGTLERAGAMVPIRAKSFALLVYMARNAGRVLSKDELLGRLWPDVTVTEDSLTQAISDLRRAIGDAGPTMVRTIARRGYLFAIPLDSPDPAPGLAQPRVAILPFRGVTGDPDDDVLIDGLVEEITHGLARFRTVTVIARQSAFTFRPDDRPGLAAIGARLGADYLVDGAVRRSGGRFLITVALSAAAGERQLWGEAFDCDGEALVGVQDVIARRIVARLVTNIEESVLDRAAASATASPTAFEHVMRAVALLRGFGEGVNERGREHLLRAIEIDPEYGLAQAYLALAELMIAGYGLAPRETLERAAARSARAVELAPLESRCHRIAGYIRSQLWEFAAAERAVRRAYELNPYDAETLFGLGDILMVRGRAAEGLDWMDRAIALNPFHPDYYFSERSFALYMLGRYDEAAAALECLPRLSVRQEGRMAATLAMAGRLDAAVRHLDRAEALAPGWPHLQAMRESYHMEHAGDLEHFLVGLQTALDARGR